MPRSTHSSNTLSISPATLHCRMPAEWEPHAATWLAWPHYHGDWPGKFDPIPWVYTEIIRNLARHERVELIVNNAPAERQARKQLLRANADVKNIRFHRWPTNRSWLRDSGCIFVNHSCGSDTPVRELPQSSQALAGNGSREGHDFSRAVKDEKKKRASAPEGELQSTKFCFNAWAKYSNWRQDEKIGSRMTNVAQSHEVRPLHRGTRIVLEGGSIDVNGQGIHGDDTHGHVDDLTRFVSPDTVVTMIESNPKDVNHKPLRDNLRRLQSARDQAGKALNIVELPMPGPVVFEKRRLPASYANFYIANGALLVPVFNHVNDRIALNTLAALFPAREVVPIYSGDLVWGLGTMHCMTQQQP